MSSKGATVDRHDLVLHCGARHVERAELAKVPTPEATPTWFPVSHFTTVDTVEKSLNDSGFVVRSARYGLSRNDARMFATLDLEAPLADGVTLAVGIRNSIDKSLPLGFIAGSRVFVCDNLAFRSELLVSRKHTRFGRDRFGEAIAQAVQTLGQFREQESARIERLRLRAIDDTAAESYMLRAFERGVVSYRLLPAVIREWRKPSYEEFAGLKNAWRLFNAFTTALMPRAKSNPQQHAALTMKLGVLLENGNGRHEEADPGRDPEAGRAEADAEAAERTAAV
jgi:hypothetical protein